MKPVLAVLVLLLVVPAPARCQPPPALVARWNAAQAAARNGKYRAAIDMTWEIYKEYRAPGFFPDLAQWEERDGRPQEAVYLCLRYFAEERVPDLKAYAGCKERVLSGWQGMSGPDRESFLADHCPQLPDDLEALLPQRVRDALPQQICAVSVRLRWSPPLPAQIFIDQRKRPVRAEPGDPLKLRRGPHRLRIAPAPASGYLVTELDLLVRPDLPEQDLRLSPMAMLVVNLGARARVKLDDKLLRPGFIEAQELKIPVSPGLHEVTAIGRWLGRRDVARVEVAPGAVSLVRVRPPSLLPSALLAGAAILSIGIGVFEFALNGQCNPPWQNVNDMVSSGTNDGRGCMDKFNTVGFGIGFVTLGVGLLLPMSIANFPFHRSSPRTPQQDQR